MVDTSAGLAMQGLGPGTSHPVWWLLLTAPGTGRLLKLSIADTDNTQLLTAAVDHLLLPAGSKFVGG